jgi:HNH endonuclease
MNDYQDSIESYQLKKIPSFTSLCYNGKRKTIKIDRLVLQAFVGECPADMNSCHNDGNKENNSLYNLRYDTKTNNELDKRRHGTAPIGENHGQHKLSEAQVRSIRKFCKMHGYGSQSIMARRFGVSQVTISHIINYNLWKHI